MKTIPLPESLWQRTDNQTDRIQSFVLKTAESFGDRPHEAAPDPFWRGLRDTGSELWLDSGDMEAAAAVWSAEFSALTTNNTLLNAEIQKGIYDTLVPRAAEAVAGLEGKAKLLEIAFILNAVHGLRLVKRFNANVSVELHTDLAHDIEATCAFARRYRAVNPERFIIKIPLTPAGLIAARRLSAEGMRINYTLGFGARQNFIAAGFARPSYVNVFLGRCNSYLADNGLGSGEPAGEKATLASRAAVAKLDTGTRQIAASMRAGSQVAALAGVDVYTMPVKVAADAKGTLDGSWASRRDAQYTTSLGEGIDPESVRPEKLWEIGEAEQTLLKSLTASVPASGEELAARAGELGVPDLFPVLSEEEHREIARGGKIPNHARWTKHIAEGKLALDSLLNLGALHAFAADQRALDERVTGLIGAGA